MVEPHAAQHRGLGDPQEQHLADQHEDAEPRVAGFRLEAGGERRTAAAPRRAAASSTPKRISKAPVGCICSRMMKRATRRISGGPTITSTMASAISCSAARAASASAGGAAEKLADAGAHARLDAADHLAGDARGRARPCRRNDRRSPRRSLWRARRCRAPSCRSAHARRRGRAPHRGCVRAFHRAVPISPSPSPSRLNPLMRDLNLTNVCFKRMFKRGKNDFSKACEIGQQRRIGSHRGIGSRLPSCGPRHTLPTRRGGGESGAKQEGLMSSFRLLAAAAVLVATAGSSIATEVSVAGASQPRWVTHVERFQGGISNGVRFSVSPGPGARTRRSQRRGSASQSGLPRQQRADERRQLPADAAERGIGRLQHRRSARRRRRRQRLRERRCGRHADEGRRAALGEHADRPGVRPHARRLHRRRPCRRLQRARPRLLPEPALLLPTLAASEVQVFVSLDNGATWTPGRQAAVAATNFDSGNGKVDDTVFNDKEYMTVDNMPTQPALRPRLRELYAVPPHADGSSDFCPIQLAYTDSCRHSTRGSTCGQHTSVVPDDFGRRRRRVGQPVLRAGGRDDGALDIAYVLEECNTQFRPRAALSGLDRRRRQLPPSGVR